MRMEEGEMSAMAFEEISENDQKRRDEYNGLSMKYQLLMKIRRKYYTNKLDKSGKESNTERRLTICSSIPTSLYS